MRKFKVTFEIHIDTILEINQNVFYVINTKEISNG